MFKLAIAIPLTVAISACTGDMESIESNSYELSSPQWCSSQSVGSFFGNTTLSLDDGMYLFQSPTTNTLLFVGDLNSNALETLTMETFEESWLPQYKGVCSGQPATTIVDAAITILDTAPITAAKLGTVKLSLQSTKGLSLAHWSSDISFDTLTSLFIVPADGGFEIPDLDIGTHPCNAGECPGGIVVPRKWRIPRPIPRPRRGFEF